MEQQALIEANSLPPPGCKPWSKGLGTLLLGTAEDGPERRASAIRLIAINPTLRSEAERLLPVLDEMKAPATPDEIKMIVGREMPAWGVSAKHAAEYGVTFGSYVDALEGLSAYCIEEGVVRWNQGQRHDNLKDAGFPPRPAQLAMLAHEVRNELYMAAYRAKLAVTQAEERAPRVISEEERAQVKAGMEKLLREIGAPKGMPKPVRPSISQHEAAARLRAAADRRPTDDVGEVI